MVEAGAGTGLCRATGELVIVTAVVSLFCTSDALRSLCCRRIAQSTLAFISPWAG